MFATCNNLSRVFNRIRSRIPIIYLRFNSSEIKGLFNKMNRTNNKIMSVSSQVRLSILGNGANANPVAIAVSNDRETFLINCGEGVQRLLFEHKIKIGKIKHVLFSNVKHEAFSGFFGFMLTIAPRSLTSEPNIHNLNVYTHSKMLSVAEIYKDFLYNAKNVNLNYHFVDKPNNGEDAGESNSVQLLDDSDFNLKSVIIRKSNALFADDISVAYVFVTKNKPGQLLLEKCKKFKVPPGPLFAQLKSGQEIQIEDRIVSPNDVLGPPEIGPAFIVLDCPTIDHIESLIQNGTFTSHLDDKSLDLVIHITPTKVFNDERYQLWLKNFDNNTKHILLNRDNQGELCLLSSSIFQIKLGRINQDVFKLLNEIQLNNFQIMAEQNVIQNCPTLLTYNIRPLKERGITFNQDFCELNSTNIIQSTEENLEFVEQLKKYQELVDNKNDESLLNGNTTNFQPNVLFLGTGSATPGKLRNTSSILVNLEQNKSMFFDCGEATFLQLNRYYGREMCQNVLKTLKAIFISHIHADHHFGLVRIIKERAKLFPKEPLFLIAPTKINEFLRKYSNILENLQTLYTFIPCNELKYQKELNNEMINLKREALDSLSLNDLVTVEVPHCYDSYGIVITTRENEKIAYSGDSTYSNAFDDAGKDCLLLIHEATMNDDLREEAELKRHSTISDAIQVGLNCNARFTMLTHFSQRYAKIAPVALVENPSLATYIENNVGFAFDFMNVDLRQLWKATRMKSVLETLFADEIHEMQSIQMKNALKRKLIDDVLNNV
ncbi:Zinc phosphodiesterase ELAC protein 2 [Blomia tropicalis]|nr:Zinc phosphodiesterase ELAC protein 2 [Blomia tropicalis]